MPLFYAKLLVLNNVETKYKVLLQPLKLETCFSDFRCIFAVWIPYLVISVRYYSADNPSSRIRRLSHLLLEKQSALEHIIYKCT